jgi:hypothetical protein
MHLTQQLSRKFSQTKSLPSHCQTYIQNNFFCLKCTHIADTNILENITPFELFKQEQIYKINIEHIGRMFKEYQMKLHPDRLVHFSEDFAEESKRLLLRVNADYRLLLDDVKRSFLLVLDFVFFLAFLFCLCFQILLFYFFYIFYDNNFFVIF